MPLCRACGFRYGRVPSACGSSSASMPDLCGKRGDDDQHAAASRSVGPGRTRTAAAAPRLSRAPRRQPSPPPKKRRRNP
ncbi:hypothetical protein DIPPA_05032 [Diplonema papillatum]|nr:hypothetical protein DIPPA_05032 [Diplonema papillatum]